MLPALTNSSIQESHNRLMDFQGNRCLQQVLDPFWGVEQVREREEREEEGRREGGSEEVSVGRWRWQSLGDR